MPGLADIKTCKELLENMPAAFRPDKAGSLNATFQFDMGEPENFTGHIVVADGAATYQEGPADHPDVTVKCASDTWLKVAKGEQNGTMAFMSGKIKATGDISLLMRLNDLFKA
jgi:putative sterol carrier protein